MLQEGSAKSAQSLADELAAKKEQTQEALAETEKALADLKGQTADAQKAAEDKLKALSLDQNALDKVLSRQRTSVVCNEIKIEDCAWV